MYYMERRYTPVSELPYFRIPETLKNWLSER